MTNLPDRPLKADPDLFEVEQRLRHGNYLRGETRELRRILEDDCALVSSLELDINFILGELERFYAEAVNEFGDPVIIDGKYEVTVREDRGKIACPWGDRFFAPKAVVVARNLHNGCVLKFSILGLHMIRCHGFFQGVNSPFRIEPEELKIFFGK